MDVTGKPPTRQTLPDGQPSGLFLQFAQAALWPLDRYAVQGVDNDVKAVIADMAKLDP